MRLFHNRALSLFILLASAANPAKGFTLSGTVMEKGSKAPVVGASLYLEPVAASTPIPMEPGENTGEAQTANVIPTERTSPTPVPLSFSVDANLKGRYQVTLPEGVYRLTVAGEGFEKATLPLLAVGKDIQKDFYLARAGFSLPEVVVSAEKSAKTEISHEILSKEELTSVPGTVGDPMRALQSLPGVINAGIESGQLLVRGSGPDDNLYLVDRIPIGFPFHFGGAISTLNSDLVKTLDFSAGGFGPQYASGLGGLVDVEQRDPRQDHWGFRADVNLLMSEAEIEGPITSNSSLSIAGRRSYLELLIDQLSSNNFTVVPAFGDYQVKYTWKPSARSQWDFEAFGSDDKVGVNVSGIDAAQDPETAGNFNFHEGYNNQGVNYRYLADDQNTFLNTLSHTDFFNDQVLGTNLYLNSNLDDFGDWFTWRHDFDPDTQFEAGAQYDYIVTGVNGFFYQPSNQANFTVTLANKAAANSSIAFGNGGLYVNQKFKAFDKKLELAAGARVDYSSYNSQAVFEPRLSAAYIFSDNTTLKASYGNYSEYLNEMLGLYLDPNLGNPGLEPELDSSVILGIEQKLAETLSLRVEGYNKNFSQMIVTDPVFNYSNAGSGYARGVEIFLRRAPSERFFGWMSYSFSDSERRNGPGAPLQVYDFDEPNILTVVANYKLNPGWDAGFKWIYSSGLPYTPFTEKGEAVTFNGSQVIYVVPSTGIGATNSARLPNYMRLDISTSFTTIYNTWQWRLYFDILNVLHNQDVLGYQYNNTYSNYNNPTAVNDLPFLPYIGFEAKY